LRFLILSLYLISQIKPLVINFHRSGCFLNSIGS
jgi:hypothetical protein